MLLGEVQEWLNWTVSKTVVPSNWYRGFESLPLRQCLLHWTWMSVEKSYPNLIGWSHVGFIVPVFLAAIYGVYWHGLLLSLAVIVSLIFHSRPESVWRRIDPVFAYTLIGANLYLCWLSNFPFPYFEVALVFVGVAFFFYFRGRRDNYEVNHSLWHLASAVITTCCLLGYITR